MVRIPPKKISQKRFFDYIVYFMVEFFSARNAPLVIFLTKVKTPEKTKPCLVLTLNNVITTSGLNT